MAQRKSNLATHSTLSNIGIGKERDYCIENLATLLSSGMDISLALDAVKSGVRSTRLTQMLGEVKEAVDSGSPLWKALEQTDLFPAHITSLIRLGEETGRLSDNLTVIVNQQRKDRMFRSRVRSAMMYPALVFVIGLVVGLGISWFILPRLGSVFSSLNLTLPLITRVMIRFGTLVGQYGSIVIPSALLIIALIWYVLFIHSRTKHLGQSILFTIPGVGRLIQEVELARFGYILGTLLAAGLTVPKALHSLCEATDLFNYQQLYQHLGERMDEGNSFQKSFLSFPRTDALIPPPIQQMIVAAERSATLSKSMLKIGETFEDRAETTTKNLSVLIEPILLVIIWLGVISVALAVILPIYSMLGGINKFH